MVLIHTLSLDNISTTALIRYLNSLGGPAVGCPSVPPSTFRARLNDMPSLLACPHVSPAVNEVVDNIASAIKTMSVAATHPVLRNSVSPSTWDIYRRLAPSMQAANRWVSCLHAGYRPDFSDRAPGHL